MKVGKNALFVSEAAALPVEDRYRNPSVCTVKEKVYKYGFGVKVRRLLPHVKRHIYPYNCGVLYPTADFAELKGKRAGLHVSALLRIGLSRAAGGSQLAATAGRARPPDAPHGEPPSWRRMTANTARTSPRTICKNRISRLKPAGEWGILIFGQGIR